MVLKWWYKLNCVNVMYLVWCVIEVKIYRLVFNV